MIKPLNITSMCALVWLRSDLTREDALAYWRGPHGQIANKVWAMQEYLQHHFSREDHGFWPVPEGVGGITPSDWRIDGLTEVRISSILIGIIDRLFRMKDIALDEFNVFDRVLANNTLPGGGRWWTGAYQRDVGFRSAVLIRARHELRGKPFRKFIESTLAPAFLEAGALELRTHIFTPGGRFSQWTPEVRHDQPANRAYSGALMIGTKDRAEFEKIMASPSLRSTQDGQRRHCLAIHSYAVENTYPCVLDGIPQAQTWN